MTTLLDELGASCNRCGRCCLQLGGSLPGTAADLRRWEGAGPAGAAVLSWVTVHRKDGEAPVVDLWNDPDTNSPWRHDMCPWIVEEDDGEHACGIYELRPDVCREYPGHPEQIESTCVPGGVRVWLELPRR